MKRRFKVTVDGKTYDVEVEETGYGSGDAKNTTSMKVNPGQPRVSSAANFRPSSSAAPSDGNVRAPAPGKVLKVWAAPGLTVNAGDDLILLESMKIETKIESPVNGKVGRVNVKAGDTVKTGDLMVVIQP